MSRRHCNAEEASMSPAERDARRQIRGQRRFFNHLAVFLLVGSAFAAFTLLFRGHSSLHFWPLGAWAVALAIHGVLTLLRGRWLGAEWEEHQLRARLGVK